MIRTVLMYFYNFFFNYPTPANLTNVWNFGVLSFVFLMVQIVSGIGLSMYYIPNEEFAFFFVEWIMRDTYVGWFFRYVHSNGASLFFFCVYLHMFRSLYYFSFIDPKVAVWNTGVLIMLLMIITAFTGYVLPWGQMSFWACTVITNLASVIPFFGPDTVVTIWGSYGVSTITLNRFYTAHFILPFVIFLVMVFHFYFLHKVGSSNGVKIFQADDKKKFHPYFTWKDVAVVTSTVSGYIFLILNTPNYLSHADNYIPADALTTPMHIVPEWYFLPFYAMLRAVPNKLAGVLVLLFSIAILFAFPEQIKDMYPKKMWTRLQAQASRPRTLRTYALITERTNPVTMKYLFWVFSADCIALGYLGMQPVEQPYTSWAVACTWMYFIYFASSMFIHSYHLFIVDLKGCYIPLAFFSVKLIIELYRHVLNEFEQDLYTVSPKAFAYYKEALKYARIFAFSHIIPEKYWRKFLVNRDKFFACLDKWNKDWQNRNDK